MKPLERARPILPAWTAFYAMCAKHGMTMEAAKKMYHEEAGLPCWRNDLYVVTVREVEGGYTHLSIRRDDRAPCRDWRHFQQIKNQLCGPEREGLELYPAESRVVDGANQYHLWVLPSGMRIPCGYNVGLRDYDGDPDLPLKQRGKDDG